MRPDVRRTHGSSPQRKTSEHGDGGCKLEVLSGLKHRARDGSGDDTVITNHCVAELKGGRQLQQKSRRPGLAHQLGPSASGVINPDKVRRRRVNFNETRHKAAENEAPAAMLVRTATAHEA